MAELVLGVGTSHSPLLMLDGREWLTWGTHDVLSPGLYDEHGVQQSFESRLAEVGDRFAPLVSEESCIEGRERTRVALQHLSGLIAAAELDAVIVVGDDQREHLLEDNLPALMVYWGDTITNFGTDDLPVGPDQTRKALSRYLEEGRGRDYTVATDLARHLIETMCDQHFDVASSQRLPRPERSMGHAFAFPLRHMIPANVPIVPVMLNTYNPPSQPRVRRCIDYGRVIRAAVESFPRGRIAVLASGGLSHFLVLEDLDARFLDCFKTGDLEELASIPEAVYQSGTSEVKNWIVAAAACDHLSFELLDYVPGYRTLAGSGIGLAFATWT